MRENKSVTVRELKEYVRDLPEVDDRNGSSFTVWILTKPGYSSEAYLLQRLNQGDIILATKEVAEQV